MKTILLLISLALLGSQVHADTLGIIINGKAIHLDDNEWNEDNWGTGVQYEFSAHGHWTPFLSISGFIDSNRNNSYYAGGGYKYRIDSLSARDDSFRVELGGNAFLMTRKNYLENKPFFGALPVLTIGSRNLDLNITYVPPIAPKLIPLFFMQAVYKIELD